LYENPANPTVILLNSGYLCANIFMATFHELGLNEQLLASVEELGFTQPTTI